MRIDCGVTTCRRRARRRRRALRRPSRSRSAAESDPPADALPKISAASRNASSTATDDFAQDVAPTARAALEREQAARDDVLDADGRDAARRRERAHAAGRDEVEEAQRVRTARAGPEDRSRIDDDEVELARRRERELLRGALGVDVVDAQVRAVERRVSSSGASSAGAWPTATTELTCRMRPTGARRQASSRPPRALRR
jgi:hypothetical protein